MLDTYKFIEKYKRISIIGMEKNVGKTTLLNKLIADIGTNKKLGLTSIGRDGEDIDVVTNTDKPRIYVRRGSIIATGRNCLAKCDITKEILYVTDFTTPMGSIVIVRALSDGYVDIAGPSYNKQVKIVVELMEKFGSEISIVDGALGRKSTAISDVSEATILSTGAALSLDMLKVVEETKKTVYFLKLDEAEKNIKDRVEELRDKKAVLFYNKIIEAFINNRGSYEKITLLAEDGTKFFLSSSLLDKAKLSGMEFQVLNKINLLFVTINPHSPLGVDFNKEEFKNRLQNEVSVPVINVLGD